MLSSFRAPLSLRREASIGFWDTEVKGFLECEQNPESRVNPRTSPASISEALALEAEMREGGRMGGAHVTPRTLAQRHRPYDPEAFAAYCELLGEGTTTLRAAPLVKVPRTTIYAWVDSVPEAADMYARARERQAEAHADRITEAAFDALEGRRDPNACRVFIDAMKWQASKLRPKVYGDKLDIALETRAELLVLDYGRSDGIKQAPVIDVTPTPALPTPNTPKRKRSPKRERVKKMSAKQRAKYKRNRAIVEQARKAALDAMLPNKSKRTATERKARKPRG